MDLLCLAIAVASFYAFVEAYINRFKIKKEHAITSIVIGINIVYFMIFPLIVLYGEIMVEPVPWQRKDAALGKNPNETNNENYSKNI